MGRTKRLSHSCGFPVRRLLDHCRNAIQTYLHFLRPGVRFPHPCILVVLGRVTRSISHFDITSPICWTRHGFQELYVRCDLLQGSFLACLAIKCSRIQHMSDRRRCKYIPHAASLTESARQGNDLAASPKAHACVYHLFVVRSTSLKAVNLHSTAIVQLMC